jgi:hypothetical protein
MEYPLAEILDRLSILRLKKARLPHDPALNAEVHNFWAAAFRTGASLAQTERWLARLENINRRIWDLEAAIRREPGQENEPALELEEIGRRALAIRQINKDRIRVKNEIAKAMGDCPEIKIEHASA